MEYQIKAIPTVYKGIEFRSRLEATWAAFFDQMGWRWEYEPFDMDGWLPDFVLEGSLLIEVKPWINKETSNLAGECARIAKGGHVMLLGSQPKFMANDEPEELSGFYTTALGGCYRLSKGKIYMELSRIEKVSLLHVSAENVPDDELASEPSSVERWAIDLYYCEDWYLVGGRGVMRTIPITGDVSRDIANPNVFLHKMNRLEKIIEKELPAAWGKAKKLTRYKP